VIFVVFPEVEILDLTGPMQAFHEANRGTARYRLRICGTKPRVRSAQGLWIGEIEPLPEADAGDLVVVPGMSYAATKDVERRLIRWLEASHAAGARIASVCTGAFVLGEAGLLDRRRCTTHWSRTGELQRRFSNARVVDSRLFVFDDDVMTSAGIASGIDLALAIIERAHGPLVATDVAREMVVYIRRDGSEPQESVYLDYRNHLHPGIHRVQDRIVRHPRRKHPLAELAETAGMSERNLTRVFRQATGVSIKDFTTRIRLELARALLHDPTLTIDAVATKCGFDSARQLRRIWRAARGEPPSSERPA
jgi:transcriptional regulator GlxA family with amidase domain